MIVVIVLLLLLFFWLGYNGLVKRRNQVDNAWSQIDVQLKRRHDLIPNLVETVKGYAAHERGTFEAVTAGPRQRDQRAEPGRRRPRPRTSLTGALKSLFAVAEAYPDLKANQNFLNLQEELTATEDRIALRAAVLQRQRAQLQHADPAVPHRDPRRHVQLRRSASSSTPSPATPSRCRSSSSQPALIGATRSPHLSAAATERHSSDRSTSVYEQIARNKRRTFLILFGFVGLITLVAVALVLLFGGGWVGVVIAFVIAAALAFFSYFNSDKIALAASRAQAGRRDRVPPLPQPRRRSVHRRRAAEAAALRGRRPRAQRVRDRPQPEARGARGHHRPARR